MAITSRKITTYAKNIVNLSDQPNKDGLTAAQLKAMFDGRTDEEVKTSINGIVDDLVATTDGASGADQIGATAITGGTAVKVQGILEELNSLKAADADVVHDTGNETVAGVKTFSSSPIVPTPTTDMQASTKKYVDDAATAKINTSAIVNDLTTGGATVPASAETVKTLKTQIGSQTFTEDNYVTDGASDTANIDALDMAVKDNADLISTLNGSHIALTGMTEAETYSEIADTDTVNTAFGKVKKFFTDIAATIRATVLTGLSVATATAVDATDTLLVGVGKLQAQINALDNAYSVVCRFTNPQSIVSSTSTWTPLIFDTTSDSSKGVLDPVNTTRLHIPTGVTKIKIRALNAWGANSTGYRAAKITKNGSDLDYQSIVSYMPSSGGTPTMLVYTPILSVTDDDYFEFNVRQNSGSALNAIVATWFEIEVLK